VSAVFNFLILKLFCVLIVRKLDKNIFLKKHIFFTRDNSPCHIEKAEEQPPTTNVQMLFLH
jgi:hypothetical protein